MDSGKQHALSERKAGGKRCSEASAGQHQAKAPKTSATNDGPSPAPHPKPSASEDAAPPAPPLLCAKPPPGRAAESRLRVTTNQRKVHLEEGGADLVHRYVVLVEEAVERRGSRRVEPRELSQPQGGDFVRQERKRLCWEALQELAKAQPGLLPRRQRILYDRAGLLLSLDRLLPDGCDRKAFPVCVGDRAITLTLKCERSPAPRDEFLKDLDSSALELVTSEKLVREGDFVEFGRSFYRDRGSEGRKDLGEGRELAQGFTKHVRSVEGEGRDGVHPALQVDLKKTTFYKEQPLLQNVLEVLSGRRKQPPDLSKPLSQIQAAVLVRDLKGLKVLTSHGERPRALTIAGLSKGGADREEMLLEVEGQSPRRLTIQQFFRDKYGVELRHPSLPCVRTGAGGALFPMEVLSLGRNQRVPLRRQTEEQMRASIRESAVPPARRQAEVAQLSHQASLRGSSTASEWGVRVSSRHMKAEARVLPRPHIHYGHGAPVRPPPNGRWEKPVGAPWFLPGTARGWLVLCFEDVPARAMQPFVQKFEQLARELGTQLGKLHGVKERVGPADMEERFRKAAKDGVELVLCLTPGSKPKELQDALKAAEQRHQLIAQNVLATTAEKSGRGPGGGRNATLLNILAKTNQKLGGLNYRPEVAEEHAEWFRSGVMYVGLDVGHPGPGGGREEAEPSVVGCAWNSFAEPFRFLGDYQLQEARREDVADLAALVRKALRSYSQGRPDQLPSKIIVFRDGVSDGQFEVVLGREGGALEEACRSVGGEAYAPKLSLVVVMKRHAMRLYRTELNERAPPSAQNIPPGTVVDSGVVDSRSWEFFLNAHLALQGTAKTPRYVVLRDQNALSNDTLQAIAHTLAYDHQVVSLAVSLPAPVFAAHNVAKRGRRVWAAQAAAAEDGGAQGDDLLRRFNHSLTITGTRLADKTFWA